MSPITEDQVVALLDGLAEREKDVIARRTRMCRQKEDDAVTATDAAPNTAIGSMTARIIRLRTRNSDDTVARLQGADVIALEQARAARRKAVTGFFFYTRGDQAPA